MVVVKRDGREVEFDKQKIVNAIEKAFASLNQIDENCVAQKIADSIESTGEKYDVEEIQNIVEAKLMATKHKDVAKEYIEYRYLHKLIRQSNTTDVTIKELLDGESDYWNRENSNKSARVVTTQRDYIAGITSTDISRRILLPKDIVEAHDAGIIHFHDMDYFVQRSLHNCELVNLEDMLQNGTALNGTMIERPHKILTAATIATQIITAVTSSSYGGCTINISHLAPFVRSSYEKYLEKYKKRGEDFETASNHANSDTLEEVEASVQTFNYQVNSMTNTNGQAPFLSVYMNINDDPEYEKETAMLIEEFLKQRIVGFKNRQGVYVTPAFPKLLYVLDENNISEDSKYWYLTKIAAQCTAKRMVPDYISAKKMREYKISRANGTHDVYGCMGCRSFLTPDRCEENYANALNYKRGISKYWGRFNQGVVTINLPDVALSSDKKFDDFWRILDERLELCHKALQCRHERLELATSDVAPILWRDGALARLEDGQPIHDLLHHGYSTISLGYAGLYECVKYMTGESHTGGRGKEFGLLVMQHLNDACNKWKEAEDIDYSVYGSPIESSTYKFAKCLKKRFGIIEGITDKDYITNSYHVNVREEIDPFKKLSIEAEFQRLSPGGAISYIESADMTGNIPAVLSIIKFIYENIMYAEINTKSDYCQMCGYDGEIKIVDIDGELSWKCPNCGNTDQTKMNVSRRTCGGRNIATNQNERNSRETRPLSAGNLEPSLSTNNNYKTCDVCGRHQKNIIGYYGQRLCCKHYNQIKKYGHVLDNNPRTYMDRNEYHICGDITFIDLYDKNYNVIGQAIVDTEDLNKIKYIKWKKSSSGYAMNTPKFKGSNIHMSRVILGTDQFVDHINHNTLDNRKSNLRIVTRSQNQMNVNYSGIHKGKNEKYTAHIKINQKMINLGAYVFEEEALFARWYAEVLLFKEFRYPKDKPILPQHREAQIAEFVDKKVQRL